MSFSNRGEPDDTEVLTETLENPAHENSADMEHLEELSSELSLNTETIESEENELVVESQEEVEHEEEVAQAETDIEPQEIEVESEDQSEASEDIPETKSKPVIVPPLRPLNIAPKPENVPIAVKPLSSQQLLLVQGGNSGQAIKFVNPQGQEINLANYSLSRPLTIKPAVKTLTSQGGNISVTQQKPIMMKKIITTGQKTMVKPITFTKPGQQFMVVQKSGDQQQVKLLQSPTGTKTITLQQAQEMGLLTNAKIIQGGQQAGMKRTVLINKNPPKTIKIIPQGGAAQIVTNANMKTISLAQKSPTKILPATTIGGTKGPQRIIFKSASGGQILPTGQLIQVSANQALTGGQIHQINVPGKGMQYIKFVTTTSAESHNSVTVVNTVKTTAANALADVKPTIMTASKIVPKSVATANKVTQQMVVVPAGYTIAPQIPQIIKGDENTKILTADGQVHKLSPLMFPKHGGKIPIPQIKHIISSQMKHHTLTTVPRPPAPPTTPPSDNSTHTSPTAASTTTTNENADANGIRPRKPCNCTKSQCLKLYCDCFANGEFCYLCNCMNCFNNLENEETRNLAIKACLERNPNAFRPKIGKARDNIGDGVLRKHTKGCNCKRSGCLKNYCECYEAKIACSNNCKCIGCRNIEDSLEKKALKLSARSQNSSDTILPERVYRKILPYKEEPFARSKKTTNSRKQTLNFITDDVIEATCQCLMTISDDADSNMQDEELTKKQIIEEFGGCLTEIIHCSLNRNVS